MFDRVNVGESCWASTAQLPTFGRLDRSLDVDLVVIGSGVTGITTAHLAKQAGLRVALLEADRCGSGQTGRSTAHLTAVTDVPLTRLIERIGAARARAIWEAGFAAITRIRAEIRDARIHCDFAWVRGCLHAPHGVPGVQARAALAQEAAAAHTLGIDAAYVDAVPGLGGPGVWFDGQARLHPLRYVSVLLDRIDGDGSGVYESTHVDAIDQVDDTVIVSAAGHRVTARYLVVATHVPLPFARFEDDGPQPLVNVSTSYVISGTAPAGPVDEGIYWEHRDAAYEYLRIDRTDRDGAPDLVIFGGVDHAGDEPAAPAERFARLERRLAQRLPGVRIERRWSGTIVDSIDGRPLIGEVRPGVFVATGFGGNGMTYGTLAGMMAVDAARGVTSPWADLFDVRRQGGLPGAWERAPDARAVC